MRKILLTGGSGFIGKNLKELLRKDFNIFSPTSKQLDLTNSDKVLAYLKKNKFDTVLHSAVYMVTRNSQKDPSKELRLNLRIFFKLNRCNKYFKRMFYFGSGAEYDMENYKKKMKEEYFGENIPQDDYGFVKYISAKYIESLVNVYDLRLFGIFGKYEDWEIRFISNAICKVIFNLGITIKQNVYFDYLYINDLAVIIKKLIKIKKIPFKHYNVCTGKSIDLLKIAKKIKKISGKDISIIVKNPGLKQEYSGNNSRLIKLIGKYDFMPIEKSVEDLYRWYDKNKDVINKKKLLFDK